MELIRFKEAQYPKFQSEGFAARWAFPFAKELCQGEGLDIGYGKPEWKLPGALGVDNKKICFSDGEETTMEGVHAGHLPSFNYDYIFSSHCLEHLPDWVGILNYWIQELAGGGLLFLYLPHPDQEYWRPWNNRKHINILHPQYLSAYFADHNDIHYSKVTGKDLNDSFYAIAEKK